MSCSEFEHGTTSGKRVVRVNREEVYRKDWLFKLVGTETFHVGKSRTLCTIKIEPVGGFTYQYTLEVTLLKFLNFDIDTFGLWRQLVNKHINVKLRLLKYLVHE